MHVSVEDLKTERQQERTEALRELAAEVFAGGIRFGCGDLLKQIKTVAGCADRTAETRVAEMKKLGVIRQVPPRLYERVT